MCSESSTLKETEEHSNNSIQEFVFDDEVLKHEHDESDFSTLKTPNNSTNNATTWEELVETVASMVALTSIGLLGFVLRFLVVHFGYVFLFFMVCVAAYFMFIVYVQWTGFVTAATNKNSPLISKEKEISQEKLQQRQEQLQQKQTQVRHQLQNEQQQREDNTGTVIENREVQRTLAVTQRDGKRIYSIVKISTNENVPSPANEHGLKEESNGSSEETDIQLHRSSNTLSESNSSSEKADIQLHGSSNTLSDLGDHKNDQEKAISSPNVCKMEGDGAIASGRLCGTVKIGLKNSLADHSSKDDPVPSKCSLILKRNKKAEIDAPDNKCNTIITPNNFVSSKCVYDENIALCSTISTSDSTSSSILDQYDDSSSFDTETNDNSSRRRIRFADEEGKSIIKSIHVVEDEEMLDPVFFRDDEDENQYRTILIMFLLPAASKFELVHAEYSISASTSVTKLLCQLPQMVESRIVADQKYTSLCRVGAKYEELINAFSIQSYNLEIDEILVAVVDGFSSRIMNDMAVALLENQPIVRSAVKRTKRWGRSLQRIKDC